MSIFKKHDKDKKQGSRRIGDSGKKDKSKPNGKSKKGKDGVKKSKKDKKKDKWSILRRNRNHGAVCATPSAVSNHPIATPNVRHASKNPESEKELGLEKKVKELTKEQKIQLQIGDKYKYLRDIGAGAFGTVVKAERVRGADEPEPPKDAKQVHYAIKMAGTLFSSRAKAKRFLREVRILRLLSAHESIVEMSDIVPPRDGLKFSQLSMVFEFMPADLKRIFRSKQFFSSVQIEFIMYQILLGLKFMHTAGIVHRDLKPGNITINVLYLGQMHPGSLVSGYIRNIEHEFSLASIVPDSVVSIIFEFYVRPQTPRKPVVLTEHHRRYSPMRWYRSPETILLQQEREFLFAADVWSVGCIFAELLQMQRGAVAEYKNRRPLGHRPLFPGRVCFPSILTRGRIDTRGPLSESIPDYLAESEQLRVIFDLIGKPSKGELEKFEDQVTRTYLCSIPDSEPKDLRTRFSAASEHATLLLEKMLQFDASKRISAEDALESQFFNYVRDVAAESKHSNVERFVFEDIDIDEITIRALILDEILLFNPEWKKQLTRRYREKRKLLKMLGMLRLVSGYIRKIGSIGAVKSVGNIIYEFYVEPGHRLPEESFSRLRIRVFGAQIEGV